MTFSGCVTAVQRKLTDDQTSNSLCLVFLHNSKAKITWPLACYLAIKNYEVKPFIDSFRVSMPRLIVTHDRQQ